MSDDEVVASYVPPRYFLDASSHLYYRGSVRPSAQVYFHYRVSETTEICRKECCEAENHCRHVMIH